MRQASSLLSADRQDEDIERLTGISLLDILGLRAALATAPRSAPFRPTFVSPTLFGASAAA
jgi:hypothetical protein